MEKKEVLHSSREEKERGEQCYSAKRGEPALLPLKRSSVLPVQIEYRVKEEFLLESVRNARSDDLNKTVGQRSSGSASLQSAVPPGFKEFYERNVVPHAVRKHVESDLARGKSIEGPLIGGTRFSSAIVIAHPNSFLATSPEAPFPLTAQATQPRSLSPAEGTSRGVKRRCPRRSARDNQKQAQKKGGEPTMKTITLCKPKVPASTPSVRYPEVRGNLGPAP